VWRLEWNRTGATWEEETIEWSMDGDVFHTITGSSFTEAVWDNLAHQPYYVILNMAVGGSWVSSPSMIFVVGFGGLAAVFGCAERG